MRRPLLPLVLLSACGAPAVAPNAPAPSVVASAAPTPPIASASQSAITPPPARPLAEETRATLEEIVGVDTSHGHETDLLAPIAERMRAVGLDAQIVESAPARGNLVARYKGNGKKKPLLLIAHVDVVPVEGQPWTVPAFELTEKDGFLWGRGVNDDKGMAAVIVAIALEMARTKPDLSRDVIFALTAGEETGGFAGARWLAQNHKELIDAEIALNEGGGVRLSDDLDKALVVGMGAAEKTFQTYKMTVKGKGGHSSVPPTDADPVVTLARALVALGEHRFPMHVLPATRRALAVDADFEPKAIADALRRASTSGAVSREDEAILSKDRQYNALLRTTCVTTQLEGSPQDNVLPTTAQASINCRILPDETREQTLATLQKVVNDPMVEIVPSADFGYGPYSPTDGEVAAAIEKIAGQAWPGARVVPSMGTGATDSRHLRTIGIAAYGVGVSPMSKQEIVHGHAAHGPDERRPAKWLAQGAQYLRDLTYELAK